MGHSRSHFVGLTFALAVPFLAAGDVGAQAPSTDIFLAPLQFDEGEFRVGEPINLTDREGYDNQPSFLSDGTALLYTSLQTTSDGEQTDIYRYDLSTGTANQLTATPESEYSPTEIAGGEQFSVVRDYGDLVQQLWAFPLSGGGEPEPLLSHELGPIGYHTWLADQSLLLFVLGEPPTLQRASPGATQGETIAADPGRALSPIPVSNGSDPGSFLSSFVHKVEADQWWLASFDPRTGETVRLAETLPEREDYAWHPTGWVLMGSGSALYALDPAGDAEWLEIADLSAHGIGEISRLAVHPDGDRIALVAARGAAP